MEEDTPFIDPDWLPNGSFPESTSKKLFIYFITEVENPDEVMHLIHQLELSSRIYAQEQYFKEFSKRESAKELSEILAAAKNLSQKLTNAHEYTHRLINIDAENLALNIYGSPLPEHQTGKFLKMEIDLKHTIYAIEHGKKCEMTMEYESNRTAHPEDHSFVCLVTRRLEGFLKKPPSKAQIHKTISIILDKKDALKNQINYPVSLENEWILFKVRKYLTSSLKAQATQQAQEYKAPTQAQIYKKVRIILEEIANSKKGYELSKKP
jgi:hypothetical protein